MLKKYGKYPILKISKISDIFELENIGTRKYRIYIQLFIKKTASNLFNVV